MRHTLFAVLVLALGASCIACTAAPPPPTTEQYLTNVNSALAAQDYEAALKTLDRLIQNSGDKSLAQQGRVLRIAILTALADAKKQMAEAYELGRKEMPARDRQTDFLRMRADYYSSASDRLIPAMEGFLQQRSTLEKQPIALDVSFPAFSESEPDAMAKIKRGLWVDDDDRSRAELDRTRNALARIMTRLVGAEDDLQKAQEIFQQGDVKVNPCCYLVEMSRALVQAGEIFDREALGDSRYRRVSYEIARDNVEVALELMGAQADKQHLARAKKLKAECDKSLRTLRD